MECVPGPVFSSVVECGISSDVIRYRNVIENKIHSRHFREVCVTGVRSGTKATGGGDRLCKECLP